MVISMPCHAGRDRRFQDFHLPLSDEAVLAGRFGSRTIGDGPDWVSSSWTAPCEARDSTAVPALPACLPGVRLEPASSHSRTHDAASSRATRTGARTVGRARGREPTERLLDDQELLGKLVPQSVESSKSTGRIGPGGSMGGSTNGDPAHCLGPGGDDLGVCLHRVSLNEPFPHVFRGRRWGRRQLSSSTSTRCRRQQACTRSIPSRSGRRRRSSRRRTRSGPSPGGASRSSRGSCRRCRRGR
jgi:hypothetical protein